MERYFEINEMGCNVRCKLYCSDRKNIEKVVIFGHGFGGHKDNKAAARFAERLMSKYKNIALITFNLPCHGDDVKKKLTLDDCLLYLDLVIKYAKTEFSDEIYAYATSFGAYLVLKYILENGNPFAKIALRCPAIKMYETLSKTVASDEDMKKLARGKSVPIGFDRKVMVTQSFIDELTANDISDKEYLDYMYDIIIIHGTKDEVAPFADSKEFADANALTFVPIEGADHRFMKIDHMNQAMKSIIDFFEFK